MMPVRKRRKPVFIDIRQMVEHAKRIRDGGAAWPRLVHDMALTLLQLHAGYERQRAKLTLAAPRMHGGPGEWYGFQSDDVPKYPTFIHTRNSGRWPDKDDDAEVQKDDRKDAVAAPARVRGLRGQARARRR